MRVAATSSQRARRRLVTLHRYLELGLWAKDRYGDLPRQREDRFNLFEEALQHITGKAPLYLEFGVYTGGSFRWWCEHLTNPNARFVGFDSFEGLPEDWNPHVSAGAFAVDAIPEIDDPRATLVAGWFDDTVPVFDVPEHDQLIVNIDSDLYSSAVLVLSQLEKYLVPGTIIYFDELSDVDHELRAWKEYLERTQAKTELLGIAGGGTNWMFRVVE
jgi:methyltransferase family protein